MAPDTKERIESVTENTLLKFIARLVIPPLATAAIAIGGWYLKALNETLTEVKSTVSLTQRSYELLNQSIELRAMARNTQIDGMRVTLVDHEGRIRVLERPIR